MHRRQQVAHATFCTQKKATEECPWAPKQQEAILEIVSRRLLVKPEDIAIRPGQPFRLRLMNAMARAIGDQDADLTRTLDEGVTTGLFGPIPASAYFDRATSHAHNQNWQYAMAIGEVQRTHQAKLWSSFCRK